MRIDNILKDDSLPISKKIQYIEKMIVKELNKAPDKVDLEKVHYYENLVEELGGEVCEKSDEDLAYNLVLIKNKARAAEESNLSKHIYKTQTTQTPFLKAMIAVAAVFVIIFSSFSVYALSVGGYGKAWEYVTTSVKELFDKKPGKENIDGITIITPNYSKMYNTIEELLYSEKLDILYPTVLPNDIEIESVKQNNLNDDVFQIYYYFNVSPAVSITVRNNYVYTNDILVNWQCEEYNDISFYIIEIDAETFQAICHNNNLEYIILANTYENLIQIISNMKGLTK